MDLRAAVAVLVFVTACTAQLALRSRGRALTLERLKCSEAARLSPQLRWAAEVLQRRRRDRSAADVAVAARALARALRGGCSPSQALDLVADAPGAPETLRLAHQQCGGRGLAETCERWRSLDPRPEVRILTAALLAGTTAGGPLAAAIDGVSDTIDARVAVAREVWAQAATARASAGVLVAAPVVFGALAVAGDRSALTFLLTTPAGIACLLAAVLLDMVGALWMSRITAASR
ncbi:MAG: type II secretion system F family protein [Acidimicrobiia bacterium]